MSAVVARRARAAFVLAAALCAGGAIPGPCSYDPHDELDCRSDDDCVPGSSCVDGICRQGPGGVCVGQGCPGVCDVDAECGGDQRCSSDGTCVTREITCQLGGARNCPAQDECAFDPASTDVFQIGTCRRPSSTPLALGAACDPAAAAEEDPCEGESFCLPQPVGGALCTLGCLTTSTCPDGLTCTSVTADRNNPPMCLPACNLDDPSTCPAQTICTPAAGGGACVPTAAGCAFASCERDGTCSPPCDDDTAPCAPGEFCVTEKFDNCRIEAPDQSYAACRAPAIEGQQCRPDQPASCADGFACLPLLNGQIRCVQQSNTPIGEGGDCNPSEQQLNQCEKGSACTFANTPLGGVCARMCGTTDDCAVGQCVRGNFASSGNLEIADIKVCARVCANDGDCDVSLRCDADNGGLCADGGFCLPREAGPACTTDDDCSSVDGTVCSAPGGLGMCLPPADQCT